MSDDATNVLGGELAICGTDPVTGFGRSGCCETGPEDVGTHTVCAVVTDEFLAFTASRGNELRTPGPGFPGLVDGDRWCLCVTRWREALEAGVAPPVVLEGCHARSLEFVSLDDLRAHEASPAA